MKLKWHRYVDGGGGYICYLPNSNSCKIQRGTDSMWHVFVWNKRESRWQQKYGLSAWLLKTAKERVARLVVEESHD